MIKNIWNNEPAAISGAMIALLAVAKACLRWAGVEVPAEVDTTVQVAIGAWVGLFLRSKVTPIDGPANADVKAMVRDSRTP